MQRLLAFTATAALALAAIGPAKAQIAQDQGGGQTIIVPKDKSAAFRLDYPASEIVVAAPDTLALVATTDRSFYVRGKQLGVTNILIYDTQHHLAQVVDVRVGYDVESLQHDLDMAMPGESIHASNFAGGILLTGQVSTPAEAVRAQEIAEHYAPKAVESDMTIRAGEQVQVDVRVIEAAHTAIKDLGFNINVRTLGGFTFSTGSLLPSGIAPQATVGVAHQFGAWNVDANLQALEQKGAIRTLARPNLVAMSGQEATFLAGGEFPIPIPNGNLGTTVEFKQFGVKLNVTPTVEANGTIQLKVAPEVSELDPKDGINFQGFQVPAISTRRASTQIELRDGESFAIAGMFQRNYSNTINQIPGASNVPIIGALFRSADWQRSETELVIIVTPHLTTPVSDLGELPNPLKESQEEGAIDVILDGKSHSPTPPNPDGDLRPSKEFPALPPPADAAAARPAPAVAAAPPKPPAQVASKS
ncbi:MAG TPA: type II and III secretion system protein family protein [Caulobacteraceae bacterium]|nr:type II and III secretion system protein family protein [Caulobacteraceae bacterium]